MNITNYRTRLNKAIGRKDLLKQQKDNSETELIRIKERSKNIDITQAFVQKIAKETQEKLRYHIEDIVQLALDACFPDKYDFEVKFEIKRGRTEAVLSLLHDGNRINPMDATGGGVVNLTAFALRIAAWSLGNSNNFMILDEPFANLSKDLQPRAGRILHQLSKRLKLQVIIVTHNSDMIEIADRVFEVNMNKRGISRVKQMEEII